MLNSNISLQKLLPVTEKNPEIPYLFPIIENEPWRHKNTKFNHNKTKFNHNKTKFNHNMNKFNHNYNYLFLTKQLIYHKNQPHNKYKDEVNVHGNEPTETVLQHMSGIV